MGALKRQKDLRPDPMTRMVFVEWIKTGASHSHCFANREAERFADVPANDSL